MNTYIYQAALWCKDCAEKSGVILQDDYEAAGNESADSEDVMCGPYGDGGGESDGPEHCGECGVFLDNPLTEEGNEYMKALVCEQACEHENCHTYRARYGYAF